MSKKTEYVREPQLHSPARLESCAEELSGCLPSLHSQSGSGTAQPKNASSKHRQELLLSSEHDERFGECLLIAMHSGCCGAAFVDDACFRFFLTQLLHSQKAFHITLHAYVLLRNRVLLLVTPERARVMKHWLENCSTAYTSYFQSRFERDSRPIGNKLSCSPVSSKYLIMDAQCFVESAPVRSGVAGHPGAYPWSSYCANSFGGRSRHLKRHEQINKLFSLAMNPHQDYRDTIAKGLSEAYLAYIENRLARDLPLSKTSKPAGPSRALKSRKAKPSIAVLP